MEQVTYLSRSFEAVDDSTGEVIAAGDDVDVEREKEIRDVLGEAIRVQDRDDAGSREVTVRLSADALAIVAWFGGSPRYAIEEGLRGLVSRVDEPLLPQELKPQAPMLRTLARHYAGPGVHVRDLLQAGARAIVKCAREYRDDRGRFAAFARKEATRAVAKCARAGV